MLNKLSIKNRIILLITGIAFLFCVLLAYTPNQARKLGSDILINDIEFITSLLSENLALGMQTRILDDGATLNQTLDLIKNLGSTDNQTILNVMIYDENGEYVESLYEERQKPLYASDELEIENGSDYVQSWMPMKDMDQNTLGFIGIEFSKELMNKKSSQLFILMLIIAFCIFAGTLTGGIFLAKSVTKGIENAIVLMKDIAQGTGDLTKRLPAESQDEVGKLNQWVNAFIDKLHDLIMKVKVNTEQVTRGVVKISTASAELASGAEEQTCQTSEVSSSIQEMTASIAQNAQNAGQTARISEEATARAKKGSEAMQQTRNSMEKIVQSTGKLREIIKSLTHRADQIGDIIQVIDKIADQTNLLALNAAVEAARAGEQGSGFAVVADEVRKLAERTTDATKQIAKTIESIQSDTKMAAESMDEANTNVQNGRDTAENSEKVLEEIVLTVANAMDMIQQIAAASEEQSAGAEEISSSVESISTVVKQSAVNTEVVASVANELDTQARLLGEIVGQFKLIEQ
ncbi:methyl-accepting chemotaxis protein [bacterium]|nr:methyl-accepting chemotaxis protein [bacterium]